MSLAEIDLVKPLLDMGTAGIVVVALGYIVKTMKSFHAEMRDADQKRTDAVLAMLATNLVAIQKISDSLGLAATTLLSATMEARELLREIKELKDESHK